MDATPTNKSDEQYPLLKVDGGGDGCSLVPNTNGWSVTVPAPTKKAWLDRLPELLSACWMTGMLLVIFLLILFGLGLGVLRRQPLIMLPCNDSLSTKEVHYHYIVPLGNAVPFSVYSEYLSYVATLYSSLRFNVHFLVDDTLQSSFHGNHEHKFISKLFSFWSNKQKHQLNENVQNEIESFHRKYVNVNVTVEPLSKFMAQTPIRYKWRTIPKLYLAFYARAFSVWQRGGIGMDLNIFHKQFRNRQLPDRRIEEILKQHSDGILNNEYKNVFDSENIIKDAQAEINDIFGLIRQIINLPIFVNTLGSSITTKQPRVSQKYQKNKHNAVLTEDTKTLSNQDYMESHVITNATGETIDITKYNSTLSMSNKEIMPNISINNGTQNSNQTFNTIALKKNVSEPPQILMFDLFYDNVVGPMYFLQEPSKHFSWSVLQNKRKEKIFNGKKKVPYFLSVTLDGSFIAASSKQHPLLTYMISSGCQRMNPIFAIQDAIITQCWTAYKDDVYCSNIYII